MSEAWGVLFIKTSKAAIDQLIEDGDEISEETVQSLYKAAEINSDDVPITGDEFLSLEGEPELKGDYCRLTIFGDEWMEVANDLVREGKGIEIYGKIVHEHGTTECYSLQANGKRYIGHFDAESDDCSEDSEEAMLEKWLRSIPEKVRSLDRDLFSKNGENEDDE